MYLGIETTYWLEPQYWRVGNAKKLVWIAPHKKRMIRIVIFPQDLHHLCFRFVHGRPMPPPSNKPVLQKYSYKYNNKLV